MDTPATSTPDGQYPSAKIPQSEMERHHNEEALSLYAKVINKKVGPGRLKSHLPWLFAKRRKPFKGTLEVIALENEFFQLKFSTWSDYYMVMESIPLLIDNHCIYFLPWIPNFKPSAAIISKITVWIRLPELPVEYYNFLTLIVKVVGKLIRVDPVTQNRFRCKYARVCVEIDLTRPLHSYVELNGGFLQPIQYEGLHGLCYRCGCVGHLDHQCVYDQLASFEFLNQSSYGQPDPSQFQPHPPAIPADICTSSSSRFSVSEQETATGANKFEKKLKLVTDPSTSDVSGETKQVRVISQDEIHNASDLVKRQSNAVEPSSSHKTSKSKQLPYNLSFLASSSSTDSPKESSSLTTSPPESPGPSSPMSTKDSLLFETTLRSTRKMEVKSEKLDIPAETRPMVITVDSESRILDICMSIGYSLSGIRNTYHISLNPVSKREAGVLKSEPKKIVVINCGAARDHMAIRIAQKLCETHQPAIVLLLETRMAGGEREVKSIGKKLGLSSWRCINSAGFVGGVGILWHQEKVGMKFIPDSTGSSSNMIFAAAKFVPEEDDYEESSIDTEDWVLTSEVANFVE